MIKYTQLEKYDKSPHKPETLPSHAQVLIFFVRLLRIKTISNKMEFYSRFVNFLKCTSLYIIEQNNLWPYFENNRGMEIEGEKSRAFQSFLSLLFHYGLIQNNGDKYTLLPGLQSLSKSDKLALTGLFTHEVPVKVENNQLQAMMGDFIFIRQLTHLYRGTDIPTPGIKQKKIWQKLIHEGLFDYEIRLCETLYELRKLKFGEKIKSIFDSSYYTGSGESAFRNFTRPQFIKIMEDIAGQKTNFNALDIGCGYGDYIEAILEVNKGAAITGIEMQFGVAQSTQQRFKHQGQVSIEPVNFFEYHANRKFDLVLLNYVLFYFNPAQKQQLFSKINAILNPGGSILVCQYYPLIEPLKHELAKREGNHRLTDQIAQFYSNKILYANTLWNDSVDTFVQSEQWGEFREIIGECGFKVISLTYADKFYYSLFVLLSRK